MAHFAKLNENNIVVQVIVVNNDVFSTEEEGIIFCQSLFGKHTKWRQTSYNTVGGKYYWTNPDSNTYELCPDQSKSFRKNYGCVGMFFDEKTNSFIQKSCSFPSWILNEQTGLFETPIKCPNDKAYWWNEKKQKWQDTPLTNDDYDIRLKSQNIAKEGELYTK